MRQSSIFQEGSKLGQSGKKGQISNQDIVYRNSVAFIKSTESKDDENEQEIRQTQQTMGDSSYNQKENEDKELFNQQRKLTMKNFGKYQDVIAMPNLKIPNLSQSIHLEINMDSEIHPAPTLAKDIQNQRLQNIEIKKRMKTILNNKVGKGSNDESQMPPK